MMCAIFSTQDCTGTYYSGLSHTYGNMNMRKLFNDFSESLEEGESLVVTIDSNADVVLMELLDKEYWNKYGEAGLGKPLCYNVMKAYCDAYGLKMAHPKYIGPYTLEAARRVFEDCWEEMVIIPVTEELEVCNAG